MLNAAILYISISAIRGKIWWDVGRHHVVVLLKRFARLNAYRAMILSLFSYLAKFLNVLMFKHTQYIW